MVDYISRYTYLYARTSSGLLGAPGTLNISTHPKYVSVTEVAYPWPALPPPSANGCQMGPIFYVPIPAASHVAQVLGHFSIDHSHWLLN